MVKRIIYYEEEIGVLSQRLAGIIMALTLYRIFSEYGSMYPL